MLCFQTQEFYAICEFCHQLESSRVQEPESLSESIHPQSETDLSLNECGRNIGSSERTAFSDSRLWDSAGEPKNADINFRRRPQVFVFEVAVISNPNCKSGMLLCPWRKRGFGVEGRKCLSLPPPLLLSEYFAKLPNDLFAVPAKDSVRRNQDRGACCRPLTEEPVRLLIRREHIGLATAFK